MADCEFAKGYTVEVLIQRPNVPNVTLVDLPGFFDAKESERDLEEAVVSMSEQFIKMEGTLILHVVGGDQDYGSCLKKTLIENAARNKPGKVQVVLTKLDLLAKQGEEAACEGFKETLKQISSRCFAVLGNATTNDEEVTRLASFPFYSPSNESVSWGTESLSGHLEDKIANHLDEQIPQLRDALQVALEKAEAELERVKQRDPSEILSSTRDVIRKGLEMETHQTREAAFNKMKTFCRKVKRFSILPLRPTTTLDDMESVNVLSAQTDDVVFVAYASASSESETEGGAANTERASTSTSVSPPTV